ncbi:Rieske 2Fe-2S domain-containing protein [Massilia sp. CCM 9210]|uniref:MBL fold metallo-hydrolase n=1 Tax=Massilia scottii TaxID=3057166 RepID=UPI002796C3BA|nr:Rieske 2Fe-2S domain-containing protein [Massilia sp. CCM 9210]MDQ1811725.1 Rieske 2Fe-2S domain-containing protein [Massilia sp. CCM 9210]
MKADFTLLGHAGFLIETDHEILLIDPWLSENGAFFGSWHQWPPNSHLLGMVQQRCADRVLNIFLSHAHQDHFDASTLRALSNHPRCTVFIPNYKDKYLLDTLRGMQLQTVELSEGDQAGIGIRLRVFIDDGGINQDAALFVSTPDFTFFNQNDCKMFDRLAMLKQELGDIDYYSVQFSGANWHPACFEMPAEQRQTLSRKKALSKFHNVLGGVRTLAPRFLVPAAGPCFFPFLDPALSLGSGTIFVHQDQLDHYLTQKGIGNILYPRPGERIDESANRIPIAAPTPAELERYRAAHQDVWEHTADTFSATRFAHVLQRRLDIMADMAVPPDTPSIAFNWGPGDADWLQVDLVGKVLVASPQPRPPCIVLTASTTYFSLMCTEARWQDLALSLRARLQRLPDVYNTVANIFLFADEANLASSLEHNFNLSQERIVIEHLGRKYEINRYCPHQGGDLAYATIDENLHVVCPRHSWRFDLQCGGMCKSSGMGIAAVKLGGTSEDGLAGGAEPPE